MATIQLPAQTKALAVMTQPRLQIKSILLTISPYTTTDPTKWQLSIDDFDAKAANSYPLIKDPNDGYNGSPNPLKSPSGTISVKILDYSKLFPNLSAANGDSNWKKLSQDIEKSYSTSATPDVSSTSRVILANKNDTTQLNSQIPYVVSFYRDSNNMNDSQTKFLATGTLFDHVFRVYCKTQAIFVFHAYETAALPGGDPSQRPFHLECLAQYEPNRKCNPKTNLPLANWFQLTIEEDEEESGKPWRAEGGQWSLNQKDPIHPCDFHDLEEDQLNFTQNPPPPPTPPSTTAPATKATPVAL